MVMNRMVAGSVVFLLTTYAAFAQEPKRYTLEDCLVLGLKESGTALNARRDEEIAGMQVRQARAEALPQLALNAEYSRLDEVQEIQLGEETTEMGTLDNYSVGATVRQTLYSSGRVGAAIRASKQAKVYAERMRREKERALALEIRAQFYGVLLAKETMAVAKSTVSQMEDLLKQTESLKAQANASDFDVLTAQVRVENERPELVRAAHDVILAMERLRVLAGLAPGEFDVDGKLEFVPVPAATMDLSDEAIAIRPLCGAMEAMSALRTENVSAVRSAMLPGVSAYFGYTGANSYRFVTFEDEWEWHWNAGVTVQWNLWDGDLTRNKVREAKLEREKAKTDLAETRKNVSLEVRQAYLEMRRAEEVVKSVQKSVTLAEKALEIAATRHKSGLSTYLEYTDAVLALQKAKLGYWGAIYGHMNAVAKLEYACGRDLQQTVEGRSP